MVNLNKPLQEMSNDELMAAAFVLDRMIKTHQQNYHSVLQELQRRDDPTKVATGPEDPANPKTAAPIPPPPGMID